MVQATYEETRGRGSGPLVSLISINRSLDICTPYEAPEPGELCCVAFTGNACDSGEFRGPRTRRHALCEVQSARLWDENNFPTLTLAYAALCLQRTEVLQPIAFTCHDLDKSGHRSAELCYGYKTYSMATYRGVSVLVNELPSNGI